MEVKVFQKHLKHQTWNTVVQVSEGEKKKEFTLRHLSKRFGRGYSVGTGNEFKDFPTEAEAIEFCKASLA